MASRRQTDQETSDGIDAKHRCLWWLHRSDLAPSHPKRDMDEMCLIQRVFLVNTILASTNVGLWGRVHTYKHTKPIKVCSWNSGTTPDQLKQDCGTVSFLLHEDGGQGVNGFQGENGQCIYCQHEIVPRAWQGLVQEFLISTLRWYWFWLIGVQYQQGCFCL